MNCSFAANNSDPGENFFQIDAKTFNTPRKKLRHRTKFLLIPSKML